MKVKVHLQDRTLVTIEVESYDANKVEADWDNNQKSNINIGGRLFSKHSVMYILPEDTPHTTPVEGGTPE